MFFKRFVHFLTFLFLLGAGLLTFFVILSGAHSTGTLENFYWLQADTSGFNSAPDTTRWYNYDWCGYESGHNFNCSSKSAAKPFSPKDNFGASSNMPLTFLNNRDTYYYLSRVGWAMLLIGLFFIVLAIVPLLVNIFKIIPGVAIFSTVNCWLAFFFILLSACLYTGCYVKARKAFHHDGRSAKLGANNFAFIWTSVFLLLVNSIWTTITATLHNKHKYDHYNDAPTYTAMTADNVNQIDTTDGIPNNPAVSPLPTHQKKLFQKLKSKKHQNVVDIDNNPPTQTEENIVTGETVQATTT